MSNKNDDGENYNSNKINNNEIIKIMMVIACQSSK